VAAINAGDTAKIDMYLSSGIDINGSSCSGFGTRYIKLRNNHGPLKAGDYYDCLWDFCTPFLFTAIRAKNFQTIEYLIKKGADVNKPFKVPVKISVADPYDKLKAEWKVIGYEDYYPLNECLSSNRFNGNIDIKIIKLLLDKGANPNNAIADAKATNNLDIINLLVEKGVKFNYTSIDLLSAIEKNNSQAYDFYIKSGVKADCACFIAATKKGDISKLNLFLQQGCNINCYNAFSYLSRQKGVDGYYCLSPLGWAVLKNDLNLAKFLVENGADLNARCIWHDGGLDPSGKNQSLSEFADAHGYEKNKANPNLTEYLLLAPAIQKKALEEKQNSIKKFRSEAATFIMQGKMENAKESYNKAFAISRDKKDQDGVVVYFRDKGSNSFDKIHNYDSAAYYFSQAYKLSNMDIDKNYYTNSCFKLGKYDDAIKNYNELLSSTELNKGSTYRKLGLCYEKKGEIDNANINYRKSLEFSSENNYYQKACLYSLLNEKENALANLKKAFENGYKNFEWLNNDHDFDNINKSEEFTKIVNKYKKKLLK
jgi:Tfp pilus assembly protein PilF